MLIFVNSPRCIIFQQGDVVRGRLQKTQSLNPSIKWLYINDVIIFWGTLIHDQFDQFGDIGDKILIVTCLVLFTCKELLDDRLQLRSEIFAMEPALKENLGASVNEVP